MPVLTTIRVTVLILALVAPLARVAAQAEIDTVAIATLVGRAIGREAKGAAGPYMVDTSGTGAQYSVAAIEASGLRVMLVHGASTPVCRFHPAKKDPDSPYLFRLVVDSLTSTRAVVSSEVSCDNGPFRGYWARMRYELRRRHGHWQLLPGRRVMVT